MSIKVYVKKGVHSYKEKKLTEKVTAAIQERLKKDPNYVSNFKPATNFDELQKLYHDVVGDEIQFQEVPAEKTSAAKGAEGAEPPTPTGQQGADDVDFNIDPMNRSEPVVRDYVNEGTFVEQSSAENVGPRTFEEPLTFNESFAFPDEDSTENATNQGRGAATGGQSVGGGGQKKTQQKPMEPVNPEYNQIADNRKARSNRRFAKYVVEVVTMLAEQGCLWYATKDINDAKLAEYEIKGTHDLSLLLNLTDGQRITVREFFQSRCMAAQEMFVFTKEEKEDLAGALADVMIEKGIAPTPAQELMLTTFGIFSRQAIAVLAFGAQNKAVLATIRVSRPEEVERRASPPPPPQPTPTYTPPPPPAPEPVYEEPLVTFSQVGDKIEAEQAVQSQKSKSAETTTIIESPIETQE